MKRVRWPDNILSEGYTCIHGYFTIKDIEQIFVLCPSGHFTPTFYEPKLVSSGHGKEIVQNLRDMDTTRHKRSSFKITEFGFYFTFPESEGQKLLDHLKEHFPMVRGEPC
jgi:hypothetical protein